MKKAFMYTWHEGIASRGSQEIGSCLMHYIKNYVNCEKLIMYSDQCGGQNRNIRMSTICNYIVGCPAFSVTHIDHKFLVSGHSFLPCDQDFGIIEKHKRFYKDIFTPTDWERLISTAKKKHPFVVIKMDSTDIKDIAPIEKLITNRKISLDKSKVEWLKIQWLRFEDTKPFIIQYKYSNNEDVHFSEVDVSKRNASKSLTINLEPLYPAGRSIEKVKYKDLQELKQFIPPVFHKFYDDLTTNVHAIDEDLVDDEET